MSKRAEQRALQRYALKEIASESVKLHDEYVCGYEEAEKDLALNIDDLELLHTLLYAVKNNKQGCFTFTRLSNEQYEEVLRRFNEQRNRQ